MVKDGQPPPHALDFILHDSVPTSNKPQYSNKETDMCSLHNFMNKKDDSFMDVESSPPETSGYFGSADIEALTDTVRVSSDGEYLNRRQLSGSENKTDSRSCEENDDTSFLEHEILLGNLPPAPKEPVENSITLVDDNTALVEDTPTSAHYPPVEEDRLAVHEHSQPLEGTLMAYDALTDETLDLYSCETHEDNTSERMLSLHIDPLTFEFAPDTSDVTIYNLSQTSMQRPDEINLDVQFHTESYQSSDDYMQIPTAAVGNKVLFF